MYCIPTVEQVVRLMILVAIYNIWIRSFQQYVKGTVSRDFLLLVFFMNQFPLSIPLGPFRIFSKIRGDIRSSRLTTGITDTGGKFCHQFH
jgi:hypothetical protein